MILLIIALLLIGVGLVSWFITFNPFFSYLAGAVLGGLLTVSMLRKLGKKAHSSLIAFGLFTKLSSYTPSYTFSVGVVNANDNGQKEEDKELISILKKQMGFKPDQAREATDYALSQNPQGTLEDKIKMALKYLDNGHKKNK